MILRVSSSYLRRYVARQTRLPSCVKDTPFRFLSSSSSPTVQIPLVPKPPSELNDEIVDGVSDAIDLYIRHGLGKQRLTQISKSPEMQNVPFISKWQQVMEAFLGVQVHALAGLGYSADEQGLTLYNQQLASYMQIRDPGIQEEYRIRARDIWRNVLSLAFDFDLDEIEEVSIVDARNIMHKVSTRMQDAAVLEQLRQLATAIEPNPSNQQLENAQRHHIVQDILINHVYLGGDPPLVEEFGFGKGHDGYVKMQCVMSEHQSDPLVLQYTGGGMVKLFEAAGLDLQGLQQQLQQK